MSSAAIYARVSSARQKKDETIGSQTAALREHAEQARLDVPEEWVFEDEGHSGATLVRPALEALRDLAAQGCLDVVLCYSPDRLARKFAYQALLLEEFARAGVRVEFVKGPRGDTPEDQLLVQFQGIFAEYEKAQLAERYRRGKAHRARTGSVNVLSGAPFGYRYVRKTESLGMRRRICWSSSNSKFSPARSDCRCACRASSVHLRSEMEVPDPRLPADRLPSCGSHQFRRRGAAGDLRW